MPYSYPPLRAAGGPAIRLLVLLPAGKHEASAPLRCNLNVVSVTSSLPYEALSYAWGDGEADQELEMLGEGSLPIRTNLHEALRQLRLEDRPRVLWVDAICINQSSNSDKNEQIPLMRQIYRNASEVIIWLGTPTPQTLAALGLVPLVLRAEQEDAASGRQRNLALAHERPDYFPPVADPQWAHLRAILELPWFNRAWVVQEAAVARGATILHGAAAVKLDDLLKAVMYLVRCNLHIFLWSGFQGVGRLFVLVQIRTAIRQGQDMPQPLGLLLQVKGCFSSDPRDKIFAFHGLFSPGSFGATLTRADYGRSCGEIYHRAAVEMLRESHSLDILSVARPAQPSSGDKMPSWVPDWGADDNSCLLLNQVSGIPNHQPRFCASGGSVYEPEFRDSSAKLVLRGHIIDKICLLSRPLSKANPLLEYDERDLDGLAANEVENWWLHWSAELVAFKVMPGMDRFIYPRTGEYQSEAYWQTRVAGCADAYKEQMRRAMAEQWARLIPIRQRVEWGHEDPKYVAIDQNQRHMREIEMVGREAYAKSPYVDPAQTALKIAITLSNNRTMFKTETGYIGIAPPSARVGDHVALARGGKLPLVIRPAQSADEDVDCNDVREWELVGDSYTHGATDGSLWRELEAERAERVIVLV